MNRYLLFLILFPLLSPYSSAQKKKNERTVISGWDAYLRIEDPIVKLDKAIGWIYDEQNNNWISGKNEIINLDNFEKLEFGIGILDGKKYLFLKKTYMHICNYHDENNTQKRWSTKDKRRFVYILDLEQYKQEVSLITNSYNVLYLDILIDQNIVKDDEIDIYPINITKAPFYETRRQIPIKSIEKSLNNAIEKQDKEKIDKLQKELKRAKTPYRDRNKLIIKFLVSEDIVRFFIFRANTDYQNAWNGRYIPQNNFFQSKNVFDAIQINNDIQDIMWSDVVFDYFHYEIDYNKFMNFIQAPLNF